MVDLEPSTLSYFATFLPQVVPSFVIGYALGVVSAAVIV